MAKKKAKAPPRAKRLTKAEREFREGLQKDGALGKFTSTVATALTSKLRNDSGDAFVSRIGDARKLVIGVPLPSLAFEYMLHSNIIPLGKLIMLVGLEKVGKSALLFEIVRWFRKLGGFGVLLEHESKFSPEWASAIIGWDEPDALTCVPCDSIEDWQRRMTATVQWVKKRMTEGTDEAPASGKTWPLLVGVDSIMGKSTETTQKKITETGASQQHFATEAGRITDYMRYIPQQIARWPISMIGVNHLKPSIDPVTQARIRQMAGGRGVSFQESIELEVRWGGSGRKASQIRLVDRDGMMLRISCENNSFGPAHRFIDVTVWSWQQELEDNLWRPITVWDWHGSTTKLLMREDVGGSKTLAKNVKQVVNIQKVSGKSLYYARALGVPKSDPQPADVIGQMVFEDARMMKQLRKLLKISRYSTFEPGVDFDDQIRTQKAKSSTREVRKKKTAKRRAKE